MKIRLHELSKKISHREPTLSTRCAERVLNHFLDIITEAMEKGDTICLKRLGTLSRKMKRWHFHDKGNRFNPFDNKHRRGMSFTPSMRFSEHLRRAAKKV